MTTTLAPERHRIESIDILRGLIMLIMALDHVRDYFHMGQPDPTNLATTTPILFFTRWITHFCAPIFLFLSGISACLAGTRRTKGQLSAFLVTRGLWLLVVEFAIINFAQTLDPLHHVIVFQVIWAIGASMIILGLLVWAPLPVIGVVGAVIFFGHNFIDVVNVGPVGKTLVWNFLLSATGFGNIHPFGSDHFLLIAYALLPWTGVMLIGYVFGALYRSSFDAFKRRRILVITGLSLLGFFILFRALNWYGDPAPWSSQKNGVFTILSFFNVTKYPCSLLYLCMTLGTALITLAFTEKVKNKFTAMVVVYGNVPLFYYICHWYLIRIINVITYYLQGFTLKQMLGYEAPATYGYALGGVYVIWLIVIVSLFYPCRWYGRYKKTHAQWWLGYL